MTGRAFVGLFPRPSFSGEAEKKHGAPHFTEETTSPCKGGEADTWGSPALPVRPAGRVFQRPVARIISQPGNEATCSQWGETLEKLQEVCRSGRLQGLRACCSEGEL